MTGITHKQAGRYMRADLDGLLIESQSRDLTAHLDECEACRLESESLSALTARLQNGFLTRWDTQHGPSTNVITNIQSQSRRVIMSNRIKTGLKIFAGLTALILLGFFFNPIFKQLQEFSEKNNHLPNPAVSVNANNNTDLLTVQQVQALAGFDVLVPSYLPEGYTFQGADYNSQTQQVILKYVLSSNDTNKTGIISIYQKRGDFLKNPGPPPYTTPVPVRNVTGKFTHGVWVYDSPNATTPRWEGDDDYYALSWQKDGTSFMVDFLGGVSTPPVQLDGLTAIAESLKSATTAQQSPTSTATTVQKPYNGSIAFTSFKDGNVDIYTMHADGSNIIKLTNNPTVNIVNTSPVWSPDGKRIAFNSDRADPHGNPDVFVMNSDGKELTQLTDNPGWDEMLAWSPDGQKIVYLSNQGGHGSAKGQLIVANPDGSNKTVLTKEQGAYVFLGWSPDGQKIVYAKQKVDIFAKFVAVDGTYIVERDGSNLQQIESGGTDKIYWSDAQQFYGVGSDPGSPDGSTPPLWTIYKSSTDGSPALKLASYGTPIVAVFDKTYVVESQSALEWFSVDGSSTPIATWNVNQRCKKTGDGFLQDTHTVSPNRQQAFVTINCDAGTTEFYLESADGSQFVQLTDFSITDPFQVSGVVSWSPDGRYVTMTVANSTSGSTDVYLFDIRKMLNAPSTKPIQLTTGGSSAVWQPSLTNNVVEQNPTLEPPQTDNRLIAFTSNQDGNLDIYTMHADGSGLTNLTNNPARDINPFWSPDGKRIAFESARTGFMQIYLMDADGTNVVQLTDGNAVHALGGQNNSSAKLWSPDGSKLIFSQQLSNAEQWMLYVMDINTKQKTPLFNQPAVFWNPSWSQDGKHIAFILNAAPMQIYVADADGNNLNDVTRMLPSGEILGPYLEPHYFWSSDGQSILFIASGDLSSCEPECKWKIYEVSPDGKTLTLKTTTRTPIGGWWQGTYFIIPFAGPGAYTWMHPDGIFAAVNPTKDCQRLYDSKTGGYTDGSSSFKQSSNGNVVIGAFCPNGAASLVWVDSTGTEFVPLLNQYSLAPSNTSGYLGWAPVDFVWSSDDQYIAFNSTPSNKTDMYILNVSKSKKDPSTPLIKVSIGGGQLNYLPSWQPLP